MKNFIKRLAHLVSSAIFVILMLLIVLILGYVIRVKYLAGHNRLSEVKLNFYTILTQSMYPTIKAGDIIITYKNDNDIYNNGDVITFISEANGNITITHRVNEVYSLNNEYSYKTKGDNNNAPDTEITKGSNVLGKVVLKIPKAGFIQQFLVSDFGWIIAIVVPCLGIVIYDILKLFKTITKKSSNVIKNNNKTLEARKKLKDTIDDEE